MVDEAAGFDEPGDLATEAGRAVRDLSKITSPSELQKATDVARSLLVLVDEILASALRALAYAIDLGDTSGGRVIAGDISSRHDFGFAGQDTDLRARQPWAEPEQVIQTSVPWHVAGSLLGLELGLRKQCCAVVIGRLPSPATAVCGREVSARTVSLLTPTELADRDVETMVDAISAGRQRVAQLGASADNSTKWPTRLRWTVAARRSSVDLGERARQRFVAFLLAELLTWAAARVHHPRVGRGRRGASTVASAEFPTPGGGPSWWAITGGRYQAKSPISICGFYWP
jgi:hypothetical protein